MATDQETSEPLIPGYLHFQFGQNPSEYVIGGAKTVEIHASISLYEHTGTFQPKHIGHATAQRLTVLPVIPVEDFRVSGFLGGKLTNLVWDIDRQIWTADMFTSSHDAPGSTFDEGIKQIKAAGWTVTDESPRQGY